MLSVPPGTEMVHFPGSAAPPYGFRSGYPRINTGGLPHSEIPGSKPVCGSPELIAAYHVLHRHLSPRHSPYALSSLTIDMRTDAGVQRAFASPPTTSILLGTLRCVWSEKTTVCRIFSCQRAAKNRGGEYRARTGDLLVANQALSQLS